MTRPKEKPILFSGPMVNAILEGRKTQTRRVIKNLDGVWRFVETNHSKIEPNKAFIQDKYGDYHPMPCPYGEIGDHLWVRETWLTDEKYDHTKPSEIPRGASIEYPATDLPYHLGKKRQSIFMPRWASRITMEITDIHIERLQDITDKDALAEGIQQFTKDGVGFKYGLDGWNWSYLNGSPYMCRTPIIAFEDLWGSINGKKHPWESNPWVWVVEFKKARI